MYSNINSVKKQYELQNHSEVRNEKEVSMFRQIIVRDTHNWQYNSEDKIMIDCVTQSDINWQEIYRLYFIRNALVHFGSMKYKTCTPFLTFESLGYTYCI